MRRRFARWPLVGAALVIAVIACDPDPPPPRLFLDDFEESCEGMPCGWERVAGDEGDALWVETFHPGEHGLRLEGEAAVRSSRTPDDAMPTFGSTLSLRMAARCDAGASLAIDVVVVDGFGVPRTGRATVNPPSDWTRTSVTEVRYEDLIENGRVSTVVIRKRGPGSCEIGELVLDDLFDDFVSC